MSAWLPASLYFPNGHDPDVADHFERLSAEGDGHFYCVLHDNQDPQTACWLALRRVSGAGRRLFADVSVTATDPLHRPAPDIRTGTSFSLWKNGDIVAVGKITYDRLGRIVTSNGYVGEDDNDP